MVLKKILLILTLWCISFAANALTCVSVAGHRHFLPQLNIYDSTPIGTVVWSSPTLYNMSVPCSNSNSVGENVYIYPKVLSQNLAQYGLMLGMWYNGQDLGDLSTRFDTGVYVPSRGRASVEFAYSLYLKKIGTVTTPQLLGDRYLHSQFDGVAGVDYNASDAFRIEVFGWSGIKTTSSCIVDVDHPGLLEYGGIPAWNTIGVYVANKIFPVRLYKRNCPSSEPISIKVRFNHDGGNPGDYSFEVGNGTKASFFDIANNGYVPQNMLVNFGLMNGAELYKEYNVYLHSSGPAIGGFFSATYIFVIYYE